MGLAYDERMKALDRAFLFVIGTTGLLFAILQSLLKDVLGSNTTLLLFAPFLFSGLIYPFYVGCLRGTILPDCWRESVLQRVRGWTYFIAGLLAYGLMTFVVIFRDFVQIGGLEIFPFLLLYFLGMYLCKRWVKSILFATRANLTDDGRLVTATSVGAALLLPYSTFFLQEWVKLCITKPLDASFPYLGQLWYGLGAFLLFVVVEKTSIALLDIETASKLSWLVGRRELRHWLGKVLLYPMLMFLIGISSSKLVIRLVVLYFVVQLILAPLLSRFALPSLPTDITTILLLSIAIAVMMRLRTEELRKTFPKTRDEFARRLRAAVMPDC
jgi:hypothetical protein